MYTYAKGREETGKEKTINQIVACTVEGQEILTPYADLEMKPVVFIEGRLSKV